MTESEKLNLGESAGTALNQSYTCTFPNCDTPSHIIKDGCPNESAEIVEARKLGVIMATTVQYVRDHPA